MPEIPRFIKADFSDAEVEIWTPDHIEFGRGFRCKRSEFREYWFDTMPQDIAANVGRAWIIRDGDNLAAYITLLADTLRKKHKGQWKRLLEAEGVTYGSYPAVKIGRLASDDDAKKSGKRLLKWALNYIAYELAPKLGIRFVTVDALYDKDGGTYDASGFYLKYGFQFVNPDESIPPKNGWRSMFLDIKALENEIERVTKS